MSYLVKILLLRNIKPQSHLPRLHIMSCTFRILVLALIVEYMEEHDSEVVDAPPFKRGAKGSIYSCLLEPRQERPDFEVKYYYYPMLPRGRPDSVVAWRFFDEYQCRPFHPPGGPCPY